LIFEFFFFKKFFKVKISVDNPLKYIVFTLIQTLEVVRREYQLIEYNYWVFVRGEVDTKKFV